MHGVRKEELMEKMRNKNADNATRMPSTTKEFFLFQICAFCDGTYTTQFWLIAIGCCSFQSSVCVLINICTYKRLNNVTQCQ